MTSYRQLFYHVIFHTKGNNTTLNTDARDVYNYLWGIVKNKKSKLYQINGIENHIHLLVDIHPTIAVADFMQDLKAYSSAWIKQSKNHPKFTGWANGYGCLTNSIHEKDRLIKYIKGQKEHHKTESFEDEYRRLLNEHGIEIDERYFLK
ncbi:IS200/IS605 family transposase [Algoriphagus yeomjeoni]|uniref:REP element-mobilizing transposase RayT n=1 Tax=Algoriphagus yeomjeoni TaxID=291403 RepID=A0A327PSX0_9BACT|nr:IS200/IS605 family transposase [Algoriphagus yeomjeoni]RAI95179.1 REP element-mobilizing transposase RayT [Algoriphagus yeomjeoni]